MRIDEILARMIPGIAERVMRPNEEVLAAIVAHGWTQTALAPLKRVSESQRPIQYELRV